MIRVALRVVHCLVGGHEVVVDFAATAALLEREVLSFKFLLKLSVLNTLC